MSYSFALVDEAVDDAAEHDDGVGDSAEGRGFCAGGLVVVFVVAEAPEDEIQ